MRKVLVCGGREFDDEPMMIRAFASIVLPTDLVIHGGAPGADQMAGVVASSMGLHVATIPAMWEHYGKSAGPIRNKVMAELLGVGDVIIAFPGGNGTANCVRQVQERIYGEQIPMNLYDLREATQ